MKKLPYILLFACILNSCSSPKVIDQKKEDPSTENKVEEKEVEYFVLNNVDKNCLEKENNKIYQAALNNESLKTFFSNSTPILYINSYTSEQCPFDFFGVPVVYHTESSMDLNNIKKYTFVANIEHTNDKKALVSFGTPINGWYGKLEVHKTNGEWVFVKKTNMSHYNFAD